MKKKLKLWGIIIAFSIAGLLSEQINRDIWSDNEAAISRYLEECIH